MAPRLLLCAAGTWRGMPGQLGIAAIALGLAASLSSAAAPVSFSRDVLPILSDNCLNCHGPDEKNRKAGLRLDLRDSATSERKGVTAIVPGKPEPSALIARILSAEPDERMPPPKSHKPPLSAEQVSLLRQWIEQGAIWGKHWAFEQPTRPAPPIGSPHPVDAFIHSRLRNEQMEWSPEAPRPTLIRRVSFDLIGLPPTPGEVDAFVSDKSPQAWELVVDRLLASGHFGERMALWWLDGARYADTDGHQSDDTRTNWPWRDWVAAAFNRNEPFDQFTIEQFAGDLLPNHTPEQTLATCFHRNHMTNGEGGRDPEESRVDYVIDRVNTVGTVWLGLTLGCAQCHSHKFDPISQSDYYALSAFFNSIDEDGKAGRESKPFLKFQSPQAARAVTESRQLLEERKARETKVLQDAEAPFEQWLAARLHESLEGFQAWHVLKGSVESTEGTQLTQEADGTVQASGANPNQDDYRLLSAPGLARVTGLKLDVLPHASHTHGGLSRGKSAEFILTNLKVQVRRQGVSQVREIAVNSAVADFSADKKENNNYGDVKDVLDDDPRNGWTTKGAPSNALHTAVFAFAEPWKPRPDERLVVELRQRSTLGDANIGRFRLSVTDQRGEAVRSVTNAPMEELVAAHVNNAREVEPKLRARLFAQFLEDHEAYREAREALELASNQLGEAKKAAEILDVMVLTEREKPRDTHVLVRGVWDKKGDRVDRGVPDAIAPWPANSSHSRLGLAQWLVSRENPLTTRVLANHLWQLLFGAGLVRTPEDFGLQGERPTHPELLDWLAVELRESGWDVKRLIRLIATSETYRQSSNLNASLAARDPQNLLMARGPRYRLPSWMLRDAALRSSGLLNTAYGGPPVRPYQPEGVWEEIFMGRFHYEPSQGAAQYRRTLYAFWRRTIAPTFLFDSAQRRVCEVRTPRTNTPLQALTLLNDETYLEASRSLAGQMLRASNDAPERLRWLYRRVLSRPPTAPESAVLLRELDRARTHYRAHPDDALKFLTRGQTPPDARLDAAELAAHTVVASLVLNLDEAMTRE